MKLLAFIVLVLYLESTACFSQEKKLNDEFTFLFYNSENLYDTENDSLKKDDEFTPEGDRRWNYGRLRDKANRIAKVIMAAGQWNPPVIIGLCEIEGNRVLDMLVRQTPLSTFKLKFIHKDSPDERGIDVALIYRPDLFKPIEYQAIVVADPENKSFKTREILRVSGILHQCDTIHFFVNHWPSRYGGLMETVRYRSLAAGVLKKAIDELYARNHTAKIVCMGDFNDTPKDESLSKVLQAKSLNNSKIKGEMVNLSYPWMVEPVQTLKNMYSWQVFDQWIVSDYFIENGQCFQFLKTEIFKAPFLLEEDKKYGGVKPKRTYVGFKYQDGFSDHLPVMLKFRWANR